MPHLNNKQNKNTNQIICRQDYHLTEPCLSEEKGTNKQKFSTNLTLYEAYTNHWTKLRRAETQRNKEFNLEVWEKENSKHNKFFKKMKRQRNTTKMKEQTRNAEDQINEEEIGKLPEKEFRIIIVKMIKKLEN